MQRYRVINFAELDSTNRYACGHLAELSDGDVIQAGFQTAGRGRWERSWRSDVPGNLCLSLVLKPAGDWTSLPLANLSQLLALSTCRTLARFGVTPTLKWPNDIQVAGQKIAGLLAESVVQGRSFLGLVLGLGLNLNLPAAVLHGIDQPATALNQLLQREIDPQPVRNALLDDFFAAYPQFLTAGFASIQAEYRARCAFLGREIVVRTPPDSVRGLACDLTARGELVVQLPTGELRQFTQGEIQG